MEAQVGGGSVIDSAKAIATRLIDLGIGTDRLDEMASKGTSAGRHTLGNFVKLDQAGVRKVLELAV